MEFQINRPIEGNLPTAEYNAAILRALELWTNRVPGLDQWRFIIEEWVDGERTWLFDVSPATGKGNECAEAKIATLAYFPEVTNTSELCNHNLSAQENLTKLEVHTGQKLVHWYGGIRLKLTDFTLITSGDSKIKTESAEIRAAFSGASQYTDAFLAIVALMAVNETFAKLHPETYTRYDFSPLEEDPVTGFVLNILR
jgi:hypothetical protein